MPDTAGASGAGATGPVRSATIALVEGSSFCLSHPTGDIADGVDGLFVRDVRLLSRLQLRVNGEPLDPLSWHPDGPASATFVSRVQAAAGTEATLAVVRTRHVGHGLREDLVVRNVGVEPAYCELTIAVDGDLAVADDVRAGRAQRSPDLVLVAEGDGIVIATGRGANRNGCRVSFTGSPAVSPDAVRYEAIVPAKGQWSVALLVVPIIDGEELEPRYRLGDAVERHDSSERRDRWRRDVPIVETDHVTLARTVALGADDLGSLRVLDPEYPERAVVVAGAPWHLSLLGRDALLTSFMALVVDPDLALGTLETLARFQGESIDERTEEEPGRILHRMRVGPGAFGPDSGAVSYGSVDATPLFVMLLGELRRWGLATEVVDRLLPHADRALDWIESYGDRDGDGYVEYQRATDRGVAHQGWKDTADGICHLDGRPVAGPIALAEVQGYVYGAYLARAHFATESGDADTAERYRAKAAALKQAFNRDFWIDDRGWLAMGLDGHKRHVDVLASNMGHCLWTGILDEDKAAVVAKHLLSPELFSGWGVRTLAEGMRSFNPMSLHAGAIWPHDSALCGAGLMRYGFVDEAHRVIDAQLDAAAVMAGRMSILCGFDRDDLPGPVSYPEVSSTRAWSAAAPLLLLRTILRFDPWIPYGKLWLAPTLPSRTTRLRVERIPLLGGRVTVTVDGDDVEVDGLPPGVELIAEPRRPMTAAVPSTT